MRLCVLGFLIVVLAGCGGDVRSPRDDVFRAEVLEVMAAFALSAQQIGRAVVASDGFGPQTAFGGGAVTDPKVYMAAFAQEFEHKGLRAVDLYFRGFEPFADGPRGGKKGRYVSWRAAFPGCRPGQCVAQVDATIYSQVSDAVRAGYEISGRVGEIRRVLVHRSVVDGVPHAAEAVVVFDRAGRVIRYHVTGYRAALTAFEAKGPKGSVRNKRQLAAYGVQVPLFTYANYLSLGVAYEVEGAEGFGAPYRHIK